MAKNSTEITEQIKATIKSLDLCDEREIMFLAADTKVYFTSKEYNEGKTFFVPKGMDRTFDFMALITVDKNNNRVNIIRDFAYKKPGMFSKTGIGEISGDRRKIGKEYLVNAEHSPTGKTVNLVFTTNEAVNIPIDENNKSMLDKFINAINEMV